MQAGPWPYFWAAHSGSRARRSPESRVHSQIRNDAEELAVAAADLAHRTGLRDQAAFQDSLQSLPETTRRGFRKFHWEGGGPPSDPGPDRGANTVDPFGDLVCGALTRRPVSRPVGAPATEQVALDEAVTPVLNEVDILSNLSHSNLTGYPYL